MVLIKVYANLFNSYKEIDLETAGEIKNYVETRIIEIYDLNINYTNPLKVKIITDLKFIEELRCFLDGNLSFDDKDIIKCIEEEILNLKYKNKLRDYISIFPNYSEILEDLSNNYFISQFDYYGECSYSDHSDERNLVDNFIGILILIHLKSISSDMTSIVASYLNIESFRYADIDLYHKHPKLFSRSKILILE